MNLNDFVVFPNKTKSVKLNVRNLQELRMGTVHLAQENKDMELRLSELREIMSQEKEEREKSGTFHWKSAQASSLSSANNKENKEKLSAGKMKIRVLKCEPLPAKKVMGPPPKDPGLRRKPRLKAKACGQCESKTAGLMCVECGEDYCVGCFAKFHQKGALKFHRMIPLQSELQTSISSLDVVNHFQRQFGEEGRESDWTTQASMGRPYSGMTESTATYLQPNNQTHSNQVMFFNEQVEMEDAEGNGSLLKGHFDEEESSRSFQQALSEWRARESTGASSTESEHHQTKCMAPSTQPVLVDMVGTQTRGSSQRPVHIEFKEDGLSYMEKLLLKINRRTPVLSNQAISVQRPTLIPHQDLQSPADQIDELTAEEMDMNRYCASLFAVSPPPIADRPDSASELCLSMVEIDETARDCRVDASSGAKQGDDKKKWSQVIEGLSRPDEEKMESLTPSTSRLVLPVRDTHTGSPEQLPLSPASEHFISVPTQIASLNSDTPLVKAQLHEKLKPHRTHSPEPSDLAKLQTSILSPTPNLECVHQRLPLSPSRVFSESQTDADSPDWGSSPNQQCLFTTSQRHRLPSFHLSSTVTSNLTPSGPSHTVSNLNTPLGNMEVVKSHSPPTPRKTPSLYLSARMFKTPLDVESALSPLSSEQEVPASHDPTTPNGPSAEMDQPLLWSAGSAGSALPPPSFEARLSPHLSLSDSDASSDSIGLMPTDDDSSDEEVVEVEDEEKKEDIKTPYLHLSLFTTESETPLPSQTAPPSAVFSQPSVALSQLAQRQSNDRSLYRGLDGYFTLGLDLSSVQTSPSPPLTSTDTYPHPDALTGGDGSWRPGSSLRHHVKEQLVTAVITSHPISTTPRSSPPTGIAVAPRHRQQRHLAGLSGRSTPSSPRPHTTDSAPPRSLSRAALEIMEVQSIEKVEVRNCQHHGDDDVEEDDRALASLEEEFRLMCAEPHD